MSPLPHLTDEDFEATLKRAFCTTAPQMLEIEPDPVAPGEPVFAPAAGTALRPPDSPPAWLTGYCWDNLEDLEGALADVTGAARELRWQQADMCAGAWLSAPDAKARPLTLPEWQAQQRLRAQERLVRRLACLRGVWIADPETARARVRDWAGDTALWQEQAA